MSENLQSGIHPDPDSLSGFVEGVLPPHERLACLAHLAECPECREVVYLAQEPFPPEPAPAAPAPERISFWKRWLRPVPVLSAAAAAATVVLSVWLYWESKPAAKPVEMAAVQHEMEIGPPAVQRQVAPVGAPPLAKRGIIPAPEVLPFRASRDVSVLAAPTIPAPDALPPASPAPAPPQPASPQFASPLLPSSKDQPQAGAVVLSQAASQMAAKPAPASAATTGIAGTITDPAGAAISGATVRVRSLASPATNNFKSDNRGQFEISGLAPGRYELQVAVPGFKLVNQQVDVQPGQMARADSTLSVGAVAETIEVTAAAPALSTESGSVASVRPLPSSRPVATTVASGKVTLAIDSFGSLFLSRNAGKKWTTVKPVWHGRVIGLIALSGSSKDPAFRLTTETGEVWLSRDGSRWYSAAQR